MKVLFVFSGNSASGKNNIVENQAASLLQQDVEIGMFPVTGRGLSGYLGNIRKLSRALQAGNYDIIHAHYGLSGIISFLAKGNEKLIVSFMGDDLIGTNRKNGSVTIRSRIMVAINVLSARYLYDFSIVKSKEMENVLLKNTDHALIPNGVDTILFHPEKRINARERTGIDPGKKILLFVSDPFRVEKNYSLAADAAELIKELDPELYIVNNCKNQELPGYYNSADLLLLTSYHEGSPNVIKEAMSCNCPIVSTATGDVEWVVGDTGGCYISSFDPKELAEKIRKALQFRELNEYTRGRERIFKLGLDSASVSSKIVEVYQRISNNKT